MVSMNNRHSVATALLIAVTMIVSSLHLMLAADAPTASDISSAMNWDTARNLLQNGISNGALLSQQDPAKVNALRQSIKDATALIQEYRQHGLSNMPTVPNVPVVSSFANLPDKLIRAELSMLQDEIKMIQEMMENPVSGTMNIPTNVANMITRIVQQLMH